MNQHNKERSNTLLAVEMQRRLVSAATAFASSLSSPLLDAQNKAHNVCTTRFRIPF